MSKYLSLALCIFIYFASSAQQILRGPYLNSTTETSVIVKWRTDVNTDSKVWFGTAINQLFSNYTNNQATTEHRLKITGLLADTKYYYAVGSLNDTLAGNDSSHYFITAPNPNTDPSIRVWATGDFGKGNQGQIDTKLSFETLTANENIDPDVWLWLGDNAYQDGKDSEYQSNVFDLNGYSDIFSWLPFWPTPGNHDYNNIWSDNGVLGIPYTLNNISDHDGPYYDIVDLPQNAEAGGTPSTHEVFYSYNYGNTHFLSLNSEVYCIYNDDVLNLMKNWIHQDLQQNTKQWTIAYWHQPPYSKGSHDSDDVYELVMEKMREEILPILESYDIDLVICGHSHVYERSYLINGHYGNSGSFNTNTMLLDGGNGNRANGTPYIKNEFDSVPQGTVYTVVGNSGSSHSGTSSNHVTMNKTIRGSGEYGSLVLDIYKNELHGRFLKSDGTFQDDYSIVKQNMEIQASNDVSICQYDSASIAVSTTKGSDHKSYTWTPGQLNTQNITVSPSIDTEYIVEVFDSVSLQYAYDTVKVFVSAIPQNPTIQESNNTLIAPSSYSNYQWFSNNQLVYQSNSNTFTPQNQGTYYVLVSSNNASCSSISNVYHFYDVSLDLIANKDSVCEGDSLILFADINGGSDSLDFFWSNPATTATNFYYTPISSDFYAAQVEDFLTNEIETDSVFVFMYPQPQANITQSANLFSANQFPNYSYQWFLDDELINTNPTITAVESGNYTVLVTDENQCSKMSEPIAFINTAIEEVNSNFKKTNWIYPNPNNGKFHIKTSKDIQEIQVYNNKGQMIAFKKDKKNTIKINDVKAGIYYVNLRIDNKLYIEQVLVK